MIRTLLISTIWIYLIPPRCLFGMDDCGLLALGVRLENIDLSRCREKNIYQSPVKQNDFEGILFLTGSDRTTTSISELKDGYYIYFLTVDNDIAVAIGRASPNGIKSERGHTALQQMLNRKPVAVAGEFLIIKGKFIWFNNRSGSFHTDPDKLARFYTTIYKLDREAIAEADWIIAKRDGTNVLFFGNEDK